MVTGIWALAVVIGVGVRLALAYPRTEQRFRGMVDELSERNPEKALTGRHASPPRVDGNARRTGEVWRITAETPKPRRSPP
jgi:hypothetical protein